MKCIIIYSKDKKNESLLFMFLDISQTWEFGVFKNIDELVIYSTVFLFHMMLFSVTIVFIYLFISFLHMEKNFVEY